jgi:transcriptional regulatory protein RtcR
MATLAPRGRIRVEEVNEEIQRLRKNWHRPTKSQSFASIDLDTVLDAETLSNMDPFDKVQLAYVASVCLRSPSISDAGREIFCVSRTKRAVTNDADRLKKYLAKFGLNFDSFRSHSSSSRKA